MKLGIQLTFTITKGGLTGNDIETIINKTRELSTELENALDTKIFEDKRPILTDVKITAGI